MLSMLDDKNADELVSMVTRDVLTYTNDDDYLHAVRIILGNTAEKANANLR